MLMFAVLLVNQAALPHLVSLALLPRAEPEQIILAVGPESYVLAPVPSGITVVDSRPARPAAKPAKAVRVWSDESEPVFIEETASRGRGWPRPRPSIFRGGFGGRCRGGS